MIEDGRVRTNEASLLRCWEGEAWQHIVKEAGTNLAWVKNRLLKVGHQVIIANACKLRVIAENESKSDRRMRKC